MKIFISIMTAVLASTTAASAQGTKAVSYEGDVKPILREHCLKCHGDDTHKADLNLQSFASLMKGGSGGEVVAPGRPGGSTLYQAIAREGDAAPMPPNRPKIADAQVAVVRQWIEQGVRETAGGEPMSRRRNLDFKPVVDPGAGPAPMPEGYPAAEPPATRRPQPVTALAASPRAPLLAVAGHERVTLVHSETRAPLGTLAFPEGVPFVLRFSRDGRVLLVAGGKPVQSGKVVLFEVRSGRRLAEVGDELDSVLAADLSPDQRLVALGGTGRVVKVYKTADGTLAYSIAKHTDWITALQFSPDGSKLATADRGGAVHLWDAGDGGIVLSLAEHKDAVAALDWRGDGEVLATGGEDGKLILWDARAGWPSATLAAPHAPKPTPRASGRRPGGVLSAQFLADGRLLTSGRDRFVRLWDGSGRPLASFETPSSTPIKVAAGFASGTLVAGDAAGSIHLWKAPEMTEK